MIAIYKKELKSLFSNMTGVVFIAWMLFWIGYYIRLYMFQYYVTNYEYVCVAASFLAFLVVPIITMRSFAEEKRSKTDQLLYSLPLRTSQIVLGKFLSLVTVLAFPIGVSAVYPLLFQKYGKINLATAYGALLALFLLGCALIAVCLFISALTESQIIAAVLSFGVLLLTFQMKDLATRLSSDASTSLIGTLILAAAVAFVVFLLTRNWIVTLIVGGVSTALTVLFYAFDPTKYEGFIPGLLTKLDLFDRMNQFGLGLLDFGALFYFVSVAALFLFFAGQALEKKRWS
ncbi:MAG: ABC transporter permease [Clostridia bacterium]|nr:ABC transporter permease [Clostridia bacterium]